MTGRSRSGVVIFCACACAVLAPLSVLATIIAWGEANAYFWFNTALVVLLFGVPIATAHMLILWLPAYCLLSRNRELHWHEAAALGAVCGAFPTFILSAGAPGLVTVFGGSGLIGGLAFRVVLALDSNKGGPFPGRPDR